MDLRSGSTFFLEQIRGGAAGVVLCLARKTWSEVDF
jgi:hypothetical protein